MINKINLYTPSRINFSSKKKVVAQKLDKIGTDFQKSLILNPSSDDINYNIYYYTRVDNLVKSYNEANATARKIIDESKQDFKNTALELNSIENEAQSAILNYEQRTSNKKYYFKYPNRYTINFIDNLTLANDTKAATYATLEDINTNEGIIFALDSKVTFKNNSEDGADVIHVFSTKGNDNIYSKIAKSAGKYLTFNKPVETSKNTISADSLLMYKKDNDGNLVCTEMYLNPKITYFSDNKDCIIRSDSVIIFDSDEKPYTYYKNYKGICKDGKFYFDEKFTESIEIVPSKENNYGIYTLSGVKNPIFLNRYIKLDT